MFDNEIARQIAIICVQIKASSLGSMPNVVYLYQYFKETYEQIEAAYEKDTGEEP